MSTDSAEPRRGLIGAALMAVSAVALTSSAMPASAAVVTPSSHGTGGFSPSADDPPASVMQAQHQYLALEERQAATATAHQAHVLHMLHEEHLEYLRQQQRQAYTGRHRQAAPGVRTEARVAAQPSYGSPKAYAESLVGSGQFGCLLNLWNQESGWTWDAENPGSGAYGIPQALPGGKMAAAGADWRTDPYTQVKWGVEDYIDPVYGSACAAWGHEEAQGWY